MLAIDGQPPLTGKSVDVSANGISVNFPSPLAPGQGGQLRFDLMIDGRFVPIETRVKALYCIFSNGEYKTGFQFLQLDLASVTALARYAR